MPVEILLNRMRAYIHTDALNAIRRIFTGLYHTDNERARAPNRGVWNRILLHLQLRAASRLFELPNAQNMKHKLDVFQACIDQEAKSIKKGEIPSGPEPEICVLGITFIWVKGHHTAA